MSETPKPAGNKAFRVRLPGLISEHEVGLGDLLKRMTSTIGIPTCASCEQRAQMLNRWMVFDGSRNRTT